MVDPRKKFRFIQNPSSSAKLRTYRYVALRHFVFAICFCKIEGVGTQAKFRFRITYLYMCNIATCTNTSVPENEKLLSSKKCHHLPYFINASIKNSCMDALVSIIKCIIAFIVQNVGEK